MSARVLLVHSDSEVIELTSRALERIGVPLAVAARGADVHALHFSIIVVDLPLADDVLRRVDDESKPIVIVTAHAGKAETLDAERVSLLVPEPYDPAMLVGVILACVAESQPLIPLLAPLQGEGSQLN